MMSICSKSHLLRPLSAFAGSGSWSTRRTLSCGFRGAHRREGTLDLLTIGGPLILSTKWIDLEAGKPNVFRSLPQGICLYFNYFSRPQVLKLQTHFIRLCRQALKPGNLKIIDLEAEKGAMVAA